MEITALLARTAKIEGAPADTRSADEGLPFTRTLAAAIAAGNASDQSVAQPAGTDIAAAEQLRRAGGIPLSVAGNEFPVSSLQGTTPAAEPLPDEVLDTTGEDSVDNGTAVDNRTVDNGTATETGNATAPPPLLAAGPDTPRSANPAIAETPAPARPANAAVQPVSPEAAATAVREQDTTIAAPATGVQSSRPATENARGAFVAAAKSGTIREAAGSTGRSLSTGPAEISAPTPTTAVAPSSAAPATAPTTAAPAQASLPSPLASNAWQQELGQQLQGMVQRGDGSVELHLNPRELGPLSVNLQLDDQGARAQFLSAHASVRSAVEQAVPQLREALAEQGISLGDTSVGEQRQESARDDSGGTGTSTGSGSGSPTATETETTTVTVQTDTAIGSGRVDLYA